MARNEEPSDIKRVLAQFNTSNASKMALSADLRGNVEITPCAGSLEVADVVHVIGYLAERRLTFHIASVSGAVEQRAEVSIWATLRGWLREVFRYLLGAGLLYILPSIFAFLFDRFPVWVNSIVRNTGVNAPWQQQ
jgi:hypothetical protein